MLNSSYTGRAPRTLEGAFGPHIRSTHAEIVPMDAPLHPVDAIVIKVSAFCCAAVVVIFTGEYLGWWPR